jgi:hypothetical protein
MSTITITRSTVEQGQISAFNKQGNRRWEAEWFTDERGGFGGDEGVRTVTLTAGHSNGVYRVTAGIATAVESTNGFKIRQFRLFVDPMITLHSERARFSQKRLKEIFDAAYQSFDAARFYAAHEVDH